MPSYSEPNQESRVALAEVRKIAARDTSRYADADGVFGEEEVANGDARGRAHLGDA